MKERNHAPIALIRIPRVKEVVRESTEMVALATRHSSRGETKKLTVYISSQILSTP